LAVELRDRLGAGDEQNPGAERYGVAVAPDIDTEDWKLRLVNHENPITDGYAPELSENADMYLFDRRAVGALDRFLSAGVSAGHPLVLTSAYRSIGYQAELFENKTLTYLSGGASREEAERLAARTVARPGESEHHLGLAADIVSENYPFLEEGFADSPEAKWMRENCAQYGFILRYAADKTDITGIIPEPWHFRYVGEETAKFMMENNLCLEEFLELY
jgi:D-alanyl-D-alanine carboxypeptidase